MTGTVPAHSPLEIPGHRFERPLGSGGYADVYLYTQEMLGRPVAVKIMRDLVAQPEVRSQFMTEANLMARLATHPSIVTILSADVSETGRPYILMEYCSKPSLAERYKTRPLSVAEALQTMIRLCGAVETAHRAGILHRDIKPANVLTTDYGWPALTDFGISAIVGESTVGEGGVSVPWSPPEAFTAATPLDARSDVYSLAATAYTVLVGHAPFDQPGRPVEVGARVYRILEAPLPPIRRPDLPDTLQRLLAVAMAKNPDERPPTAASFARALQRIEHDLLLPSTQFDVPDALVDDLERTQTTARALLGSDVSAEWDDDADLTIAVGSGTRDSAAEPGQPVAADEPDEPDDQTVVVARASEPDDHTVVVDRAGEPDDHTVVVSRGGEQEAHTVVVDRLADNSVLSDANTPRITDRVAFIPNPDAVRRYSARSGDSGPTLERVQFDPPPQRVAPSRATARAGLRPRMVAIGGGLLGVVGVVAAIVVVSGWLA